MQQFLNSYFQLLNKQINIVNSELNDGFDSCPESVNYNPIILSNLLFENVYQPDLDPVPVEFFHYILKHLKIKEPSKFEISYKKIYDILENNGFKDSDKFMLSLKSLKSFDSGYLTIGICRNILSDFNKIFKSEFMNDSRVLTFFNNISDAVTGNTFSADPLLRGKFQNVCIYLNIDMIKQYTNWKDTLSHELSHFIQRIINMDNSNAISNFDRLVLKNPDTGTLEYSNAFELTQDNVESLSKKLTKLNIDITQKQQCLIYWVKMLSQTLKISEIKTTTQNILNGFQRMYEQQNLKNNKPNYRNFEVNHDNEKYQKQRLTWLNDLLSKINSENFFESEFGFNTAKEFFSSSYKKLYGTFLEQKQFKDAVLIMQYLGIKNCLQNINIDKRLTEHFKSFKFRD
jgi:hypothetical protein